jgi:predicted acylesterase/phospholipase RssA
LTAGGSAAHTSAVGAVTASIAEATSKAASYAFNAKHKIDNIVKIYTQNGLYGMKEFNESLRPVLEGKDLSINTTLKEFYEKTGIDIHFFVTELNKFVSVDFSYKTHPNQLLVEACYMSSSLPLAFTPIIRDSCVYLDGAIINDYPLNECIRDQKCDIREIMGVKLYWERIPGNVTEKSSIMHLMSVFMSQIKANLFEHRFIQTIPNEVICVSKGQTLQDWVNSLKDENFRRELMQRGEVFAKLFLSYRRNYTSTPNTSPVQKTNSIEILVQTPALEENDAINKIIVNHDIVDVNDLPVDDLPVDVDVQPVDVDVQPVDVDDHQVDADEVISNDNNKEII